MMWLTLDDERKYALTNAQAGQLLFLGRAVPIHGPEDTPRIRLAYGFTPDDSIVAEVIAAASLVDRPPEVRVITGPAGHWYAWHDGELVCLPQSAGEGESFPPPHPGQSGADDWYAPDDLQGPDRDAIEAQVRA